MTNVSIDHPLLPVLRERVERKAGHTMLSQHAMHSLEEALCHRINIDTLRRLWNIRQDSYKSVRRYTLDILCDFIGEEDWTHFVAVELERIGRDSLLAADVLRLPLEQWEAGARLVVGWLPNRKMQLEYRGEYLWNVLAVENSSTLCVGDVFACRTIAQDNAMYIESLTRDGELMGDYQIGVRHGVHYEF